MNDGLCRCCCGKRTNLAKRNNKKRGHVKNEPVPFLPGHYSGRKAWNKGNGDYNILPSSIDEFEKYFEGRTFYAVKVERHPAKRMRRNALGDRELVERLVTRKLTVDEALNSYDR